ncbi:HVO_2922 family protein [Haloarcula laminariae]|uniref:HVO_2922 family protein n=1 Tax=Haloarcula laminariae TaxID=2961577 RepID=UPI0021C6EC9B|nr:MULTISPECIES: HVO_2922 family protein [Halomicroarcula]
MPEETIYEGEEKRSRRGLATYFRRLARRLSRGEPVPADEEQTVTVEVPEDPEFEVELEQEDDTVSLEIEVEWPADKGIIDTEAHASKATFDLYEDNAEEYRWRLVHDNGNIIADSSEGYASKQKATQGLESVRKNAPGADVVDLSKDEEPEDEGASNAAFELFADTGAKWRWRLRHDNGEIIADGGQGYSSKQKAKQGLRSVKTNVRGAEIR